tara:strand:+ start:274 stop:609 length:336 start_codon:yes stop_codon:yes gene_type:complete
MEVIAAVAGSSLMEDIKLETDQLLAEIIENPGEFGLDDDEVQHLADEDFAGRQTAEEKFAIQLAEELAIRAEDYGDQYPFILEPGVPPSLTRKEFQVCSDTAGETARHCRW